MQRFKTVGALMLAMTLLGACAAPKSPPPTVNLAGFPPAFRDGFTDGCQSAKPGAARRRDETRYAQEAQYAMGWRDGYDMCHKKPTP
jgi:hypothetical protein